MDGLFPTIFHGERSELREKYGLGGIKAFVAREATFVNVQKLSRAAEIRLRIKATDSNFRTSLRCSDNIYLLLRDCKMACRF
jgi:hypothetical protein